jgi:hypothetical protein
MKRTLVIIFLGGIIASAFGQDGFSRDIVQERYITTSNDRYTSFANYLPDAHIGSPYAEESFQPGSIYENEVPLIENFFFRYNAYEDDIEVKKKWDSPDSEVFILTKSSNIVVKIASGIYVYNEEVKGYFEVLFSGNNFKLYKKTYKKLFPARTAQTSFEKDALATYKDRMEYFLLTKDNEFREIPSSKNKRIKFFGNKQSEINKYISKNKLDMNDEDVLIKVVRYFDSFNDAHLK